MATTYKVLGQIAPSAASATTAYTVPSATQAVISTITVANRGVDAASFRIAVRPDGITIENKHYISYDVAIGANSIVAITCGITADDSDVITVYGSNGNLSFGVFGTEIA
jgi:glucose-6-phosphate dehydrogenase assembly protein OpcA